MSRGEKNSYPLLTLLKAQSKQSQLSVKKEADAIEKTQCIRQIKFFEGGMSNELEIPKKLFYIFFSKFAGQVDGGLTADDVQQSHVGRALCTDGITANEHNLLAGLNAGF